MREGSVFVSFRLRTVGVVHARMSGLRCGSRNRLGPIGFRCGDEVAKTGVNVVTAVSVQPGVHGGRHLFSDWYSFARDDSDQGLVRIKGLADADGDVDAVGFDVA